MNKLIAILGFVLLATNAYASGYTSRACGFDLDDDGVIGEASDDCNICDGTTIDPDGDGVTEDQVYVDCNSGTNSANCGTPGSPCRSISYAISSTSASTNTNNRVDGSGDGAEDIICFRATCSSYNSSGLSNQGLGGSGVSGVKTRTATGNESIDFQYPADPVMIVGWDQDNDGQYAPYDTEAEPPILDACNVQGGCGAGSESGSLSLSYNQAFVINGSDRIEVAHFTALNYGWGCVVGEACSFWDMDGVVTHHYVHDLALTGIGSGSVSGNGTSLFGVIHGFISPGSGHLAFENNNITQHGVYPFRSSAGGSSYFKFSGNTIADWDDSTTRQSPSRLWGWQRIDISDNKWDNSNVQAGSAGIEGGELSLTVSPISFVYITGNEWIDFPIAIRRSYLAFQSAPTDPSVGMYLRRNKFDYTRNIGQPTYTVQLIPNNTDGLERSECTGTGGCSAAACTAINGNCDCTDGGANGHAGMHQVYVEGNVWDYSSFSGSSNLYSALEYQNGNNCDTSATTYGPLYVQNNSFIGFNPGTAWNGAWSAGSMRAAIILGTTNKDAQDFRNTAGDVFVRNNIFSGINNDYVLINWKRGDDGFGPITGPAYFSPGTDLFMDYNTYSGSSLRFYSNGSTIGGGTTTASAALAAFRTATGQDGNSRACAPSFDTDGYTLLSSDTCAKNTGSTVCSGSCSGNADCLASNPAIDVEGDARPEGTCDIGADEYVSAVDPCAGECNTAADCNDGNVCTTDTCLGCPRVCAHSNNTLSCSDGLYCTGADTCSGGSCSVHAGTPCPGADGDSDCSETCNEATDSCTANDTDGSSCNDGLYCTATDTCSSGTCTGTTDPCAANLGDEDSDCSESCNEAADNCTSNDTDGSNCNDGLFCTEPDACSSGTCTGAALDCSASSTSCKTGTCDEGTDACITGSNKPDGTECDDGTFCNGTDACSSGDCSTHNGDPCIGGPNPICTEATDTCSAYTDQGGMVCYGCYCQGCYMK
jgi:hypothetical protein